MAGRLLVQKRDKIFCDMLSLESNQLQGGSSNGPLRQMAPLPIKIN